MICVGTQPFVRVGWVQEEKDGERGGDRGMMSSQVCAGSRPGTCGGGRNGVAFGFLVQEKADGDGMMWNMVCVIWCVYLKSIWMSKYVCFFFLCTVGMRETFGECVCVCARGFARHVVGKV